MEPIEPAEGLGVLHLFYEVDHASADTDDPGVAKELAATLDRWQEASQVHAFSVLGHKGDVMILALDRDLGRLRRLQTDLGRAARGALRLTWSYVSLTETSEYTPTPEEQAKRFEAEGLTGDELADRVAKETARLAAYNQNKLHPDMPDWEVACFYPMSHRREGSDNWYSLDYPERRRLMHEHGKSGRAFTGRVLQLVSGSTGVDDWEWGVTLFAHEVGALKEIVYKLRYDEASARYGEFGPFVIGLRRTPSDLVAEVGLGRG